jgi:DNA-binding transcriptional MocR family regulator
MTPSGSTKSGGAPSQLTSTYMTHIIRSGELQHHIDTTLLPAYAHRHHTMVNAVEEHLVPLGFQMHRPNDFFGGYFIWLALPTSLHDLDLVGECLRRANTIVASGKVFQVPGDSRQQFNNHIRLCFAFEDVSRLIEGIRRISQVSIVLLERRGDCGGNSQDSKAQQEISLDGLQ